MRKSGLVHDVWLENLSENRGHNTLTLVAEYFE